MDVKKKIRTSEEFNMAAEKIFAWENNTNVLTLKHFGLVSSLLVGPSSAAITLHFRKMFKLKNQGLLTSILPNIMLPMIFASTLHLFAVIKPLISNHLLCPICLELRSAAITVGCGVIWPLALAPVSALMNANRYITYAVPEVHKQPAQTLKLVSKMTQRSRLGAKLFALASIQAFGGILLTLRNREEYYNIEEQLEAELQKKDYSVVITKRAT